MTAPVFDFGYATLEQIAERINEALAQDPEEHTPEYLAAAYAIQAQEESGYSLCADSAEAHLEALEVAGAKFDELRALELALS